MGQQLDPETLLHTIIEGLGQPFYAVDRDWRVYLYNGDAARHFGKPAMYMGEGGRGYGLLFDN